MKAIFRGNQAYFAKLPPTALTCKLKSTLKKRIPQTIILQPGLPYQKTVPGSSDQPPLKAPHVPSYQCRW